MTRKQIAFVIGVNAVISTLISIIVVLVIARPMQVGSTPTPTSGLGQGMPAESAGPVVEGGSASPTPELVIHVVQAGDTISGLALQYDVPEADIIAANQLVNPNFLQVGMELVIPVGGVSQATATFTPAPTATDTPIPFEPPSADMTATVAAETGATAAAETGATATPSPSLLPETGELQIEISEILAPGQIDQERVAITNFGERLADMQGWTLSDADGNVYTFPNFRLWAGGGVAVHTRIGQDGSPPANFYWGKLEAIWSNGEVATLKDASGATISTYIVTGP
jgi:LysM repeat protein